MTPSAGPPAAAPHLTIGAVARAAGIAIDTIRYYEREGLLPVPARRLSGYRDYTPDAVARLRFIRRAKELGFSLPEIRELLALSVDRERGFRVLKSDILEATPPAGRSSGLTPTQQPPRKPGRFSGR